MICGATLRARVHWGPLVKVGQRQVFAYSYAKLQRWPESACRPNIHLLPAVLLLSLI